MVTGTTLRTSHDDAVDDDDDDVDVEDVADGAEVNAGVLGSFMPSMTESGIRSDRSDDSGSPSMPTEPRALRVALALALAVGTSPANVADADVDADDTDSAAVVEVASRALAATRDCSSILYVQRMSSRVSRR